MPNKTESDEHQLNGHQKKTVVSTGQGRKVRQLSPVTIVLAASILTIAFVTGLGWQVWKSYLDHKKSQEQVFPIQALKDQIVHFDEVLTMSANMAAATGDRKWEKRYRQFEPKLDAAIKSLKKLVPKTFDGKSALQTDKANVKLVEMENQVFELVGEGLLDEAQALISGADYLTQKEMYIDGMQRISRDLESYISFDLKSNRKKALISVVSVLLSLPLLALVWLWVLQNMRRYLKERFLAEEALKESEKKYRGFLEASPDATAVFNEKHQIIMVNSKMEKMFGYSGQELLGKVVEELIPERSREIHIEHRTRFFANPVSKPMGIGTGALARCKNGDEFPVDVSLGPLHTEEGLIFVASIRDITERRRVEEALRESEDRFRDFFANAPIGFHIFGPNQTLIDINDAELDMIGYTRDEIVNKKTWSDLIIPAQAEQIKKHWNDIITKGSVRNLEYTILHKDGHHIEVILNASSRFDANGKLINTRGSILNITERKRAEDERKKLIKLLEYKNKELQDIVYTASHDLRSPLVNIEGFSGELETDCKHLLELFAEQTASVDKREQIEPIIKEDIPQCLRFITSGAKKMSSLLDGLLQISRIGTVKIHSESLDMETAVKGILDSMAHQINASNITVTVDELPRCIGDAHMIDHVFTNLISNAIKYRDLEKEGIITISGKVEDGMSIFCVEDNGIGIDPDYQKKVFEIFHRLNPEDSVSGEGLGLTIVTRIMDRLGGEIWVESEPCIGCKFFIALPTVS